MKFGYLTMGFSLEHQAACAIRAEQRQFESAWLPDHLVMPAPIPTNYPYLFDEDGNPRLSPDAPLFDPWVVIGYLAALTTTLRFGTAVYLLPLRQPLATARSLVTLDHLSKGRISLGVGVGWLKEEFDAIGMPFNKRGQITDEIIKLLRRLWTEPVIAHDGEFYKIPPVGFSPKPVQKPGIPIEVGGVSPAALRRAGMLGDGWVEAGSPDLDEIAQQIQTINRHRKEAGRDHLPFEITLVNNDIFNSPDAVRRARDIGVTRIVVSPLQGPFAVRGVATQQDYLNFLDSYADTVIEKVEGE